jgi:hypothetical protein
VRFTTPRQPLVLQATGHRFNAIADIQTQANSNKLGITLACCYDPGALKARVGIKY